MENEIINQTRYEDVKNCVIRSPNNMRLCTICGRKLFKDERYLNIWRHETRICKECVEASLIEINNAGNYNK